MPGMHRNFEAFMLCRPGLKSRCVTLCSSYKHRKNARKKPWVGLDSHPPKNIFETSIFEGELLQLLIENILTVSAHVTREFSPTFEHPASMADICLCPPSKAVSQLYYIMCKIPLNPPIINDEQNFYFPFQN